MPPQDPPPGLLTTLRAAVNAGLLSGLVWGTVDWAVALTWTNARLGFVGVLGCLFASVLMYGLVHVVGLVASSPLWHLFVRKDGLGVRCRMLFGVGLGAGLALELYMHSRPYLFPGRPAESPGRLAVAAGSMLVGLGVGWFLARLWARTPGWWRLLTEVTALASWLIGGLFLVTQADALERSGRGVVNERTEDRPNVLLVVVDALRQDVLGSYGHEEVLTPHMDRIAAEGARFEDAFVQAPFTTTSFGSFMTGKHPRRHGLLTLRADVRMPDNVTLAWHLKGAGFADGTGALQERDYVNAAFMTGAVSHSTGLAKGFDVYSEAMRGGALVEIDSPWSTFKSDLLLSMFWSRLTQRTDFNAAGTTAVDWLGRHSDKRFFSWVHLYSTHTPYDPAPQFRDRYVDPNYQGPFEGGFWAWHREAIERGDYEETPEDVEQIVDLYYGGTTQADAAIGALLAMLEREGILDDTVVIITSDHGEDLGEGGRYEHNHMYETNLRIPLLIRYPKAIPAGTVVDGTVDSIDLLPTVCDLLGLALPPDDPEVPEDDVDGVSLMPLVTGEVESVRRHTFAENGVYVSIRDERYKLVLRNSDMSEEGWEALIGEVAVRAKGDVAAQLAADPSLIETYPNLASHPPRFFDLEQDPDENQNLFAPEHPIVLSLLRDLRCHFKRMPIRASEIVSSARDNSDRMQMLNDLGYAEGAGAEAEPLDIDIDCDEAPAETGGE